MLKDMPHLLSRLQWLEMFNTYVPSGPQRETSVMKARRIEENRNFMNSLSENQSRILYANRRMGLISLRVTGCSDPVYDKLNRLAKRAWSSSYDNPYWSISHRTAEMVNTLQQKIEERTIEEKEYTHILRSTIDELLKEWAQEIRGLKST